MTDSPDAHLPLHPEIFQILLALDDEPLHGYGIVKAVEASTGGAMSLAPSLLYRRLRRLMELALVAEADADAAPDQGDRRRRYYLLTATGREVLAAEARRMAALLGDRRVRRLVDGPGS